MENAVEALKMAGFMLLFIIALSITMVTLTQAKTTADALVKNQDRQESYQYVELAEGETKWTTVLDRFYRKFHPSVEKTLARLEKKKLIKEVKNGPSEIKVNHYELTKEGSRIYQEIVPKNDKMVGILAQFLTENELISFTKSLLKIRNILISLSDTEYKNQ